MKKQMDSLWLRRSLLGNAAFSTGTGTVLVLAAESLAPVLGIPALALRVVGLVLLPFAFGLARNAMRERVNRKEAWSAVILDLVWVAGSALLVFAELWPLEVAGTWTVLLVADCVFLFALLQAWGLRRTGRSAAASSIAA